jgi:hypothetical protein
MPVTDEIQDHHGDVIDSETRLINGITISITKN